MFPVVENRRAFPFKLNEVLDLDSIVVENFVKNKNLMQVAEKIITDIQYPFYLGMPDDYHCFNAYHGKQKYCKKLLDWWSKARESLHTGVSDCEDGAIAFVTCALKKGLGSRQVYVVLGRVEDKRGNVLGYHSWAYSKKIPDNKFRLYESTLDKVPEHYPAVPNIKKPYETKKWVYVPMQLFNKKKYIELEPFIWDKLRKEEKETKKKYSAIEDVFKVETKPLKAWRRKKLWKRLRKW